MDQNRKLLIAIGAAAGGFLLSYGVYRLLQSDSAASMDPSDREIYTEVKKMGRVRLNEYGQIPFDAFVELFRLIRKHAK